MIILGLLKGEQPIGSGCILISMFEHRPQYPAFTLKKRIVFMLLRLGWKSRTDIQWRSSNNSRHWRVLHITRIPRY